jgi:hypothetical protein
MLLATLLVAVASSSQAQVYGATHRAEITGFGGYQWGGSFDTDALSNIDAGKLSENSSFSWGGILSFITGSHSAVELYYLRQDTNVDFNPNGSAVATRTVGDFANNYIQLGFRQDLPVEAGFRPFISGSAGVNILEPKNGNLDSSTRFAWSLGGGARYMMPNNRIGLRTDLKWMVTPVPSGSYATWCDYWGCFAAEGTSWLHQGHFSGGLILAF